MFIDLLKRKKSPPRKKLWMLMVLLGCTFNLIAQNKVSGVVADEKNEAIAGANVSVKGTTTAVMTDGEGKFEIAAPNGSVLQISFMGFISREVTVGNQATIRVTLSEDLQLLEEVVVVGYGTQKKVNLTGSVASISGKELEGRPIISAENALQGVAAGVTVTTQSGAPGGDGGQIRIRGINSFGGSDSGPLVLIDGVPGAMNMVDINLIESISVLKDAASAAIYGSRAANGVILVTTKRAAAGKTTVNYRGYTGWQSPTNIPEVTDGLTYMRVFNEANMNDNGYPLYSEDAIDEFRQQYAANPDNFDWQKAILTGSGFTHNHFVSLSASTGKLKLMPSFSYISQDGIIKNTGFERMIFRNNADLQISDKLSLKMDMSLTKSDRTQIASEGTIWNYLGRMPTNIPIRRNGLWSEGWVNINPIGYIEQGGNRKSENLELQGNFALTYDPVKWLSLKAILAPRLRMTNNHVFTKSVMTYNEDGSESGAANTFTDLTQSSNRYSFGNHQFLANAFHTWGKHNLSGMIGASRETYDHKNLMAYRRDFTYDNYEVIGAGADNATKDNGGSHAQWLLVSTFGRLNYDFDNRYLFEANMRYDGTSRFIRANRWAAFPSFSAGWRISEESFMENTRNVIDQLKLRASWGKLGNQNIGSSFYPFAETLAIGSISMNDLIYQLVTLNTMSNPDLRWESTTMTGFGIDASFLKKFSVTAEWYNKLTDGILLTLYTSQLTGLNSPYQNAAKVRNKGWEVSLNYEEKIKDFTFGVGLNLSDVNNRIVDMKGQTSGTLLRQQEGYAINSIYGFIADGLYQNQEEIDAGPTQFGTLKPGDIRYKDIAGAFDADGNPIPDGKITDDDRTIIGSTIPRYTYGANLNLGYKGFSLNLFLQGVGKADGYLNSHYVIPAVNSSAIKPWQLDYWTEDNPGASFPRLSITSTNNTQNSTYWMRSAAYLRLKNIQVGYTLPKTLSSKVGLNHVMLFANGQNIWTKTRFWQGYDPEIGYDAGATDGVSLGGGAFYPQVKVYTVGLDIKF